MQQYLNYILNITVFTIITHSILCILPHYIYLLRDSNNHLQTFETVGKLLVSNRLTSSYAIQVVFLIEMFPEMMNHLFQLHL